MLCRKFKSVLITNPSNNNVAYRPLVQTRSFSKWFEVLSGTKMASAMRLKMIFRELFFNKYNVWTKSYMGNSVFKRCRTERGINKMFLYFREVFFRPRTHLLVTVTAAAKNTEEKPGPPKKCSRDIKDKEMRKLIKDLDVVEELSKATLFCEGCDKRIVIDTQHQGIQYCDCPHSKPPVGVYDGWVPYMEAEDVVIWRKEYKPGGLYAYKVYGRYKHLKAEDFAKIQVDGAYRKVWDTAVASIQIVEQQANGVSDQAVIHWEVLWPRLFTNRDYVYLRRHKQFNVQSRCLVHKDAIFGKEPCTPDPPSAKPDRSVHARAKEISIAMDKLEAEKNAEANTSGVKENEVYVIVSRSCTHPEVPETSRAVRVMEYWSHMVITTLDGPDHPGMEFVLTYYDEPAVGGLPTAVTSWAMGRAGPAFLERMRTAASEYRAWRGRHREPSDFAPFQLVGVSHERGDESDDEHLEDYESYKEGPHKENSTVDDSTQTLPVTVTPIDKDPSGGPALEVKEILASKASKAHSLPDDVKMGDAKGDLDNDALKYKVTVSQAIPPHDFEKQVTIDEDELHLKITIEVPISEIKRIADKKIRLLKNKSKIPPPENAKESAEQNVESKSSVQPQNVNLVGEDDDRDMKQTWWRYLYPLYYFRWS